MLWGRTVTAFAILAACTGQTIETIKHVSLSIFYEALDPDSLKYFQEELLPAFEKINKKDPHMKVVLVPNGNANYTGKCTHGPDECSLNRLMACVVYEPKFSYEQNLQQIQFSTCVMENGITVLENIEECAEPAGLDANALQECHSQPGDLDERMMSLHSNAVGHENVLLPRILVNDKYDQEAESQLKKNTLKGACKYLDNIPEACQPYRTKGKGAPKFELVGRRGLVLNIKTHDTDKKSGPVKSQEGAIIMRSKDSDTLSLESDLSSEQPSKAVLNKRGATMLNAASRGKQPSKSQPAASPSKSFNETLLQIFYEALDPESLNFFEKSLLPTMKAINKDKQYIHVNLIPYGNAKAVGKCTHGPQECTLNRLMTCATDIFSKLRNNNTEQVQFSVCAMKRGIGVMKDLEQCTKPAGLNVKELKLCTNSPRGRQLDELMSKVTPNTDKSKMVLPRIKIDMVYDPKLEKELKSNSMGFACKYLGYKPLACQDHAVDKELKKVLTSKRPPVDGAKASGAVTGKGIMKVPKNYKTDARKPESQAKEEKAQPPSDVGQTSYWPLAHFFGFFTFEKI